MRYILSIGLLLYTTIIASLDTSTCVGADDWLTEDFWQTVDGQPVDTSWEFFDAEIRLVNPRGGKNNLISRPMPPNFDLSFEWQIEKRTNTGLKYRVRKYGSQWLGVEYQIIDETKAQSTKGATASIYDLYAPKKNKPLKPAGQWNSARIVATDGVLQHFLNGELVAEGPTSGVRWDDALSLSKFWGRDRFAQAHQPGRFMLTDHGGKAKYRNFKFVELTQDDATKTGGDVPGEGPFLANGIRNGWADQNSITLWTRTTANPDFNQEGVDFLEVKNSEISKLSKSQNEAKLNAFQLPEGKSLDEMLCACPGAAGEVRLIYFPTLQRKQLVTTPWKKTDAKSDFTAQWHLTNLKPGRKYAAVIQARPHENAEYSSVLRGEFQTAPANGAKQDVRFCLTTCHDFIRRDDGMNGHKIYPAMTKLEPNFVVHAGDIEYYDKPKPWALTKELMRFKWGRIFALPNNREFYKTHTSYFIKDDHDTLKNDCYAGQTYGTVTFEQGVKLFNEEQFPSHTPRYKTVLWGRDLQIWFLEGRDFRSPNNMPDGPDKTILGAKQKKWLKETLATSKATFKLVFSPTPIVGPDRTNKRDNHANTVFAHEGAELRAEFSKHDGVIVFCGDRHWQYASKDSETGLWEFGCGPGSEKHQLGWKKNDKRPVHQFLRVAGGFLSGDLNYSKGDKPTATLTLRHRKVTGEVVSEFRFPLDDRVR